MLTSAVLRIFLEKRWVIVRRDCVNVQVCMVTKPLEKGKAWSAFEYVQRNLRYINVNLFVAGMAQSRLYDSKKTQPMTRGAVSGWLSDRTLSSCSLYGDWRDWAQAGRQVAHQTGVRWPCKTVKHLNDPASTCYTEIMDARINVSLTLWHVGQMFDGNQNFRPTKKKSCTDVSNHGF